MVLSGPSPRGRSASKRPVGKLAAYPRLQGERVATRRFHGEVHILDAQGEVAAKALCELVVDALNLDLEEWEGMLRDVEPPSVLTEGDHYHLRLLNGGQGEIVVSRVFSGGGGRSPVYDFLGTGTPPEVPSEARP